MEPISSETYVGSEDGFLEASENYSFGWVSCLGELFSLEKEREREREREREKRERRERQTHSRHVRCA